MRLIRALPLSLALSSLAGGALAAEGGSTFVVPPGGEGKLLESLAPGGEALAGAWRLEEARIEKDRIALRYAPVRPGGVGFEVTLVHPTVASASARRLPYVAIEDLPGPAPREALDALASRLAAHPRAVAWEEILPEKEAPEAAPPAPEPDVPGPDEAEAQGERLAALSRRVEHLLARGEPDLAASILDEAGEGAFTDPEVRARFAVLVAASGRKEEAAELARPLAGGPAAVLASALVPGAAKTEDLAEALDPKDACRHVYVGRSLGLLERWEEAERILAILSGKDPACTEARATLALLLIDQRKGEEALRALEPVLQSRPDDPTLLMIRASALRLTGRGSEAIDVVESIVRNPAHRHPGDMGTLLGMYLREGRRAARLNGWKAWIQEHPDDVVAPFMIGVLNHYANRFSASDAWLKPLLGKLEGEPRIYVYLAMNAFNLGRPEEARRHLDTAASLEVVDPDVYYCRAEITRDTERDVAIRDLERYLALTDGTPHVSDEKQARVHEMLDALKRCASEGTAVCEGPFEHPRDPIWRWGHTNLWAGVSALAFLAFGAALLRRDRRL